MFLQWGKFMKEKIVVFLILNLLIFSTTSIALTLFNIDEQQMRQVFFDAKSSSLLTSNGWIKTFGGTDNDGGYSVQQTNDDILPPEELWNKTFEGYGRGEYIRETSDSGYKIISNIKESIYSNLVIAFIKTDKDGNIESKKVINLFENDDMDIVSIRETSDGGYLFAGINGGIVGDVIWFNGIFLLKTDENGNEEWNFKYTPYVVIKTLNECPDGSIILGCMTTDYSGYDDTLLIKLSRHGVEQWIINIERHDDLKCVYPTEDGGCLLGGYISEDTWIMKLDKWGNEEWETIFLEGHEGVEEYASYIHPASDGEYMIAVASDSDYFRIIKIDNLGVEISNKMFEYGSIFSVQKTDDDGFIVFSKKSKEVSLIKFNSNGSDEYLGSFIYSGVGIRLKIIRKTIDDGFILVFNTRNMSNYNTNPYEGFWLIKIDSLGNKIWENYLDMSNKWEFVTCRDIDETSDGGYIICGSRDDGSGDFIDSSLWLIKFGENNPPSIPVVEGINKGNINKNYTFHASSTDSEDDEISYFFDWDDGTNGSWTKYDLSGNIVNATHNWTKKGTYNIKVKAKDEHDYESDWSTFPVSMPKNKMNYVLNSFFERLLYYLSFIYIGGIK